MSRFRSQANNSLAVVTLTLFAAITCSGEFSKEFASQEWASTDVQVILDQLLNKLESQTRRLAYTEQVLQHTLSILSTARSTPFSAVQAQLAADHAIATYIADAEALSEEDATKEVKKRSGSKRKREMTLALNSKGDRARAALKWLKQTPTEVNSSQPTSMVRSLTSRSSASDDDIPKNVEYLDNIGFANNNVTNKPKPKFPDEISSSTQPLSILDHAILLHNATAVNSDGTLMVTQNVLKDTVSTLQNVLKCALAQQSSNHAREILGVLTEVHSSINGKRNLSIQFQLKTCLKYWTSAWVNISEKNNLGSSFFFRIPNECFNKNGSFYSIEFPSNISSKCAFQLLPLTNCKIYQIEIRPIFWELQGTSTVTEVIVLPDENPSNITSITNLAASATSNSLEAAWSISSNDCGSLLSSVDLKISEEGAHNDEPTTAHSYSVSKNCFEKLENGFFTKLGKNSHESVLLKEAPCSDVAWQPLDSCRKYRLEVTPEYPLGYKGSLSSIEIFTSANSDINCCHKLTEQTGSIHWNYQSGNRGCSWLISAETTQQIWFTLPSNNHYLYCSSNRLRVFDGSFETSPLLFDSCEKSNNENYSFRSRINELYIKVVNQNGYGNSNEYFGAHYAMVDAEPSPFSEGCGGYIVDGGTITKPLYPSHTNLECPYYIRSSDNTSTLSIVSNDGKLSFPMMIFAGWSYDKEILYNSDDLTSRGNDSENIRSDKMVVSSSSDKMLVVFPEWNLAGIGSQFSWSIRKLSSDGCRFNLTGESGTIESPHFPKAYKAFSDCRWIIKTLPDTRIRLTLVSLNLVQDQDYLTAYDGSTLNSNMLKELSGTISKPVTISSSKNELLVRLTTTNVIGNHEYVSYNNNERMLGFLGAYNVVSCNK